jgi:hypothetical protein
MTGALFQAMAAFGPPPPSGGQPATLWGTEEHVKELFRDRVVFRTLERGTLENTAFEHPGDYSEHFKTRFGPAIVAQTNARASGREREFNDAVDRLFDQWNLGTADQARFEQEYLLAVGIRN